MSLQLLVVSALALVGSGHRVAPDSTGGEAEPLLPACRWTGPTVARSPVHRALEEISGLAATPDGMILAHDDERPVVREIDPQDGRILRSWAMRGVGRVDLEGIALAEERLFLITSDGILFETRVAEDGATIPTAAVDTRLGNLCEMEGLAWDPSDRVLLIACKNPRSRGLRDQVTIFRWSVDDPGLEPRRPHLAIPLSVILDEVGGKHFRPSSIDRDPRTGHYLLLSGQDRALVEVTSDGTVVAGVSLKRGDHPQAEGVAVLPGRRVVISNERAGGNRSGTLTVYSCGT